MPAVKDNQPTLQAQVREAFAGTIPKRAYPTREEGHGRQESREVRALQAGLFPAGVGVWAGVMSLVMVRRVSWCAGAGEASEEVRYFISSPEPDAERLGCAIRCRWSIEGMHWVLDVVFGEDGRRPYDWAAAENVALMNRLALSVLKGDTSEGSLNVNRKNAGWDITFLAKLIGFPVN